MAKKRMYSKDVTDSDAFIEMSSAAQALYFHLNQGADDDGFNNQIQLAMLKAHASTDDLKILMAKSFVIRFESGVIVIKHWRMHNTLRKDRYTPTNYQEELRLLGIKENGAYTLGNQPVANGLPNGCHSIDKGSVVESSVVEGSIGFDEDINVPSNPTPPTPPTPPSPPERIVFKPPTIEEVRAYCRERGKGVDPERWHNYYTANGWMVGRTKMKDWKAAVRTWEPKKSNGRPAASQSSNPFLDMVGDGYE